MDERVGPYLLEAPIARGGMGEVWRARHPNIDRQVAIKLIRADAGDRPGMEDAFIREARVLSRLRSPQTVQVLDFGVTRKGVPYLVTEFLDGMDLRQRLADGALRSEEALFVGVEILKSLSEAHAQDIVHRDLKPANIFLQLVAGGAKGRLAVKVLDFGVAKLVGSANADDTLFPGVAIKGSPRYMAPEQISSGLITARTDLYAFGGVLHHALTGEPVFDGDRDDVLRGNLHTVPPRISERFPLLALPERLDLLVARCLEKDPANRPESAEAVIGELEQIRAELLAGGMRADEAEGFDDLRAALLERQEGGASVLEDAPPGVSSSGGLVPSEEVVDLFSLPDPGASRPSATRPDPTPSVTPSAPQGSIQHGDRVWREVHQHLHEERSHSGFDQSGLAVEGPERGFHGTPRIRPIPRERASKRAGAGGLVVWILVGGLVGGGALAGYTWWKQRQAAAQQDDSTYRTDVPDLPKMPPGWVPAVVRGEVERIETGVGQTRVRLEDGVRARFVQLDTGDVVCDDATVCLVPVHTDMRIESKGRPDQVLRAAALEKRMGRTWNLTLGGGSVTAE